MSALDWLSNLRTVEPKIIAHIGNNMPAMMMTENAIIKPSLETVLLIIVSLGSSLAAQATIISFFSIIFLNYRIMLHEGKKAFKTKKVFQFLNVNGIFSFVGHLFLKLVNFGG